MEYVIASGVLAKAEGGRPLARIRNVLPGAGKRITAPDGRILGTIAIRDGGGGLRERAYVLADETGAEQAVARPDYAPGEAPEERGWPLCRMPRVDRALVSLPGGEGRLEMAGGSYTLSGPGGTPLLRITHRGPAGGWRVTARRPLTPALLCGLFIFCRYLERENEFVAV